MDSSQSRLPDGWIVSDLGTIITPSKEKSDPSSSYNSVYVGLEHIEKDTGKLLDVGTSDDVKSTKSVFHKGDLLYGKLRPYLNKVWLSDRDGICSTDILVLSKNPYVSNDFLRYRLLSRDFVRFSNQKVSGIELPRVSVEKISPFPTLLPPLPEQHRIVTKIEELLTQLDAGVASLKKAQAQLKRYRQAVLKAAFEGRLTQEWRESQNVSISVQKLLKQISSERERIIEKTGKKIKPIPSINDEEFSQLPKIPNEWIWVRLDGLSSMITDGKHGDCQDEDNSGFFFLSAKDVKNGKLHYDEARQVKKEDFLEVYNRTSLESGDVVITNSGTIGRVAVIENTPLTQHTCFQKSVAIIKPVKGFFDSSYLAYFLMGSIHSIEKKSKGTAQKNLLIRDIKDFLVAFPPHDEQKAIIEEIERHFSQIDHLEHTITTSLLQSESLRQSILKRAFEGKLVPQDPNDEPASLLLERIKAEKALHAAGTKKGKTLQPKSPKRKIKNGN